LVGNIVNSLNPSASQISFPRHLLEWVGLFVWL
jgi:hypothetical protein